MSHRRGFILFCVVVISVIFGDCVARTEFIDPKVPLQDELNCTAGGSILNKRARTGKCKIGYLSFLRMTGIESETHKKSAGLRG